MRALLLYLCLLPLCWACSSDGSGWSAPTAACSDSCEPAADPDSPLLQGLSFSLGRLSPGFSSQTLDYALLVTKRPSSVQLSVTALSPDAQIWFNEVPVGTGRAVGPIPLGSEPSVVSVRVQAPGGRVAVYTIAALSVATAAYLKPSNTHADEAFGYSMSWSGDTLAVGAPGESGLSSGIDGNQSSLLPGSQRGAVYIFRRSGSRWSQEAYIKASNPGDGDRFGSSVALRGERLLVGAPGEDSSATGIDGLQSDNSAADSGAAYVFLRRDGRWAQEAYLKASNTEAGDGFGSAVALSDTCIAVGAPGEDSSARGSQGDQSDNRAPNSGAVYVYEFNGQSWSQVSYLKASNTDPDDAFGSSLAVAENATIVGSPYEDSASRGIDADQASNGASNSGAVYVFERSNSSWEQTTYIKSSNADINDEFGSSLALSGDGLAVGAPGETPEAFGFAINSGAVYVFRRAGPAWREEALLRAAFFDQGDRFGGSVALAQDTLLVGAVGEDGAGTNLSGQWATNSARDSGAVYRLRKYANGWQQDFYLKATNATSDDAFGTSVALSENGAVDELVVGAPYENGMATGINATGAYYGFRRYGAVYVY